MAENKDTKSCDEIVGLIPAAGIGKRLYPFSRAVPKEIYPILGKPVIEHAIENLKIGGINKVFMVVGFQKGSLMDYVGSGAYFDVDVAYIYQMSRKGLGHAILQGKNWINSTFVVLLGDSFIEPKEDVKHLIDLHKEKKPIATVLLFEVEDPSGYGIVKMRDFKGRNGAIEKMVEKPGRDEAVQYSTNGKYYALCGFYVFDPKIFEYIEKTKPGAKNEIQITDAMQLAIESGEKIYGQVLSGRYLDIGKWHTVLNVERELFNKSDILDHISERNRIMSRVVEDED
jgi:dTDP-glucose pyrophosphorylase